MNRRTPLLITSMVVLPMLALHALRPTAAQAAGWSGWARCEINTQGPGYAQRDTHTWFVSNATGNTPATLGSGSWQVSGKGNLSQGNPSQTSMRGEWAINGMSTMPAAQFSVTTTGGVVTIRTAHSTLKIGGGIVGYIQQTINNSARTPTAISRSFREGERITVCGSQLSTAVLEDQFVDIASLPHLSSPNTATFVLIGERSLMALNPEISKRGDRIAFTAGRLYERSELTKDYDVLIPVAPVPKTWTGEFALRIKGGTEPVRGPPVRWNAR